MLDRFAAALDAHPADHVVRLTADCPLADPVLVEAVLARHLDRGADYTSNVFPRTFPRGLDCEVMTAAALRTAHAEATDPAEREHVTPFLYRRPERFALANMRNDVPLGREGWTVDTADDLAFVRRIVDRDERRPATTRSRGGRRGRRSARAADARSGRGRARAGRPGAQRVLPRVPQRHRRGAAQPLAAA